MLPFIGPIKRVNKLLQDFNIFGNNKIVFSHFNGSGYFAKSP